MESFTADQAAAFRLARQHLGGRSAEAVALRRGRSAKAVALGERIPDIVRDTAGVQAQVMSAAEMAIWARQHAATRGGIQRALWDTRDLVKTSAMRLTLHVIPARDFAVYIEALKPMAAATLQRWHARVGADPKTIQTLVDTVVGALRDEGPQTQQELIARARKRAGPGVRAWLDHAWSAVRPAVIEGAIVYGPPRGAEATFVHAETWLGRQPRVRVDDARAELMRRFLAAFGPASPHDFAKWSGLKTTDAKSILAAIDDDVVEVRVEDARGWMLRRDLDTIAACRLDRDAVRLLPAFDSFLLAHATKAHLVDARFYKRVYRPQGWISPVVLQAGRIVGVWFQKAAGRQVTLDVQLFARASAHLRESIAAEADALSAFIEARCTPRFTRVSS